MLGYFLRFAGSIVTLAAFVACSETSDPIAQPEAGVDGQLPSSEGGSGTELTWHGGVGELLADHCGACHQDDGGGPFVVDYDSAVTWASAIRSAVSERRMPPMPVNNDGSCQTFENARWLSEDQIDSVVAWIDAGTPLGDGEGVYPKPELADLENPDVTFVTPSYTPSGAGDDDYRCYVVDAELDTNMYITAYQVVAGNPVINHHMILYDISDPAWAEAKDAETEAPGYPCFGSAGPGSVPLALWAPGSGRNFFPEGTGVLLAKGKKVIVQMHYNVKGGVMEDKGTQVRLALSPSVDRVGQFLPMADMSMRLPPQQEITYTEESLSIPSPGLRVYGSFPHMHGLGRELRVDAVIGGEPKCLVDVDRWDFNWQESWWYNEPIELPPGRNADITIRCGYNTMGRNEEVRWGDGTDDEMCLNYFYISAL